LLGPGAPWAEDSDRRSLEAELERLLERYTEAHPDVVDLRRRIEELGEARQPGGGTAVKTPLPRKPKVTSPNQAPAPVPLPGVAPTAPSAPALSAARLPRPTQRQPLPRSIAPPLLSSGQGWTASGDGADLEVTPARLRARMSGPDPHLISPPVTATSPVPVLVRWRMRSTGDSTGQITAMMPGGARPSAGFKVNPQGERA
jgi:hypothetical protein